MNLNERAAIEIMGWYLYVSPYFYQDRYGENLVQNKGYSLLNGMTGYYIDFHPTPINSKGEIWKPTEDYNHAQMVVKRIGEMGLQKQFVAFLLELIKPDSDEWWIFNCVSATPTQLTEAALKTVEELKHVQG